jgi:peptide/nickel transport system substrate-binding protein
VLDFRQRAAAQAKETKGGKRSMKPIVRRIAVLGCLLCSMLGTGAAMAQKSGGVLKVYHRDSPASMSILEEGTNSTEIPMIFNNLVMYDQHIAQNSLSPIVPELASEWSTSEDGTQLTFRLREGVSWHDGKLFTAKDIQCTWEMLTGKSSEKLRLNPRKSWYNNIEAITTNGDHEATFVLKRPQPWLITLRRSPARSRTAPRILGIRA